MRPDGILISHSHGDHLDPWTLAPYFEKGGACPVAAPAPECGMLESMGVPHIIPARAETPFSIGPVQVTPIACAHTQLRTDGLGRFYELSYLIAYRDTVLFFGGDMSLYDGLYKRLEEAGCSLLMLPVNGAEEERTQKGIVGNMDHRQAAALSAALNVPYIPMHHDLYANNGCGSDSILTAARDAGAKVHLLKPAQSLAVGAPTP